MYGLWGVWGVSSSVPNEIVSADQDGVRGRVGATFLAPPIYKRPEIDETPFETQCASTQSFPLRRHEAMPRTSGMDFNGNDDALSGNCSIYNATMLARFLNNATANRTLDIEVLLGTSCKPEVCSLAWGSPNPDLSGIGVGITMHSCSHSKS